MLNKWHYHAKENCESCKWGCFINKHISCVLTNSRTALLRKCEIWKEKEDEKIM